MSVVYLQSPSSASTQYQLDTTGDAYTLISGETNKFGSLGIASVVNYQVARVIQNASNSWGQVVSTTFNIKKESILNQIISSDFIYKSEKPEYYEISPTAFAAIVFFEGEEFIEQVTYNPKTLEYSILRNDNPTYVSNFSAFLRNTIPSTSESTYLAARSSAASGLLGGGGFGNANRFFVVENVVTQRGRLQREVYGMPEFGDAGSWNLYEKNGDVRFGLTSYTWRDGECVGYCSHGGWLTDVYVDTTQGRPVFYFPNGGTTTRGQQFYVDIVSRFL